MYILYNINRFFLNKILLAFLKKGIGKIGSGFEDENCERDIRYFLI